MTTLAKISADGSTILGRRDKDLARAFPEYWDEATETFDVAAYRAAMVALGKPYWLPVVFRGPAPAYDGETQYRPQPTETIDALQVTQGWAPPVDKTPAEIDAELNEIVDRIEGNRSLLKGLARIVFKIARGDFAIPNNTLTLQQFKNQLKQGAQE